MKGRNKAEEETRVGEKARKDVNERTGEKRTFISFNFTLQ